MMIINSNKLRHVLLLYFASIADKLKCKRERTEKRMVDKMLTIKFSYNHSKQYVSSSIVKKLCIKSIDGQESEDLAAPLITFTQNILNIVNYFNFLSNKTTVNSHT